MFNGSIRVLDTCGGGSNPPFLTMTYRLIKRRDPSVTGVTYSTDIDLSAFEVKKTVKFTDSNYRDFEFWIYDTTVRFYYITDLTSTSRPIYKVFADLRIKDIENNIFPDSLKDFKEAKIYLKKYFEHIAFI